MPLQLVSAPTLEPLSLVEAKLHARVSTTAEDSLVTALIVAARDYAQNKTQRQIVAAKWKLVLDSFPGPSLIGVPFGKPYGLPEHAIVIPIASVQQVDQIQYLDMNGTLQTMVAGTDYVVDTSGDPTRITPPFGKIWPIPLPQIGAIAVTFRAGLAAPLTADPAADTIYVPGWKTLAVNDTLRVFARDKAAAGDGAVPAPLAAYTDFYVKTVVGPDRYQLSATAGGALIDITSAGTGDIFIGELPQGLLAWMKLAIATLYENRPAAVIDQRVTEAELPSEFLDGLLDPYRLVLY